MDAIAVVRAGLADAVPFRNRIQHLRMPEILLLCAGSVTCLLMLHWYGSGVLGDCWPTSLPCHELGSGVIAPSYLAKLLCTDDM